MHLIKTFKNIRTFSLGDKLIYRTRDNATVIDGSENDFPATSFHPEEKRIYSNRNFYLDISNKIVYQDYLKNKGYNNMHFEDLKLYTEVGTTINYFYKNDITEPVWKYDRELYDGGLRCFNKDVYIIINSNHTLKAYSTKDCTLSYEVKLNELLGTIPASIPLDGIVITDSKICITLHSQSFSQYGLFILDSNNGNLLNQLKEYWRPIINKNYSEIINVYRKNTTIKELNLNTNVTKQHDYSGALQNLVFETQTTPFIYKDFIYIALLEKGSDHYNYWAKINLQTNKIVHIEEMLLKYNRKKSKTFVSKIEANENRVAVLIHGGILHLYESNDDDIINRGVTAYKV